MDVNLVVVRFHLVEAAYVDCSELLEIQDRRTNV